VGEPDELGLERAHPQLTLGARVIELAEADGHVTADDDRAPARLDDDHLETARVARRWYEVEAGQQLVLAVDRLVAHAGRVDPLADRVVVLRARVLELLPLNVNRAPGEQVVAAAVVEMQMRVDDDVDAGEVEGVLAQRDQAGVHVDHLRAQLRHAGVDQHAGVGMVDDVDGHRPALALDEQLGHQQRRDLRRRHSPILPLPATCLSGSQPGATARAVGEPAYSPGVSSITLASGLTLAYARRGDAVDSVVLLLPGPTDSWLSYQLVLDHLPLETHAIAVSQRGHGESDKPDTGYGVEDFAADVVLLLDALGIARAVLVGHSGSCLVARRVALDRPDRVAGLFLEASPTTLRDDPKLVGSVESVMSRLENPITPDFARSFLAQTSTVAIPPDLIDLLVVELLKVPAHVWQETFSGLLEYDDLSELGRIEAPTLLVWGDEDAVVPREMQDHLARSIPGADLLVYHGVGHTPRWEDPMRFSSDLVTFTRQVARMQS
jgi:non-heme chloroperoxidase